MSPVALIPRPLHRLALRLAFRTRHIWRKVVKPDLRGVSILAVNAVGEVLLVRHSYGARSWTFPGGGCNRGEAPANTARREFAEELGAGLSDLKLIDTIAEEISGAPHTAFVFAGTVAGPIRPDRREIAEAAFFPVDALPTPFSPLAHKRLQRWLALQQR